MQIGTEIGQPDAFVGYGFQLLLSRLQGGTLGELRPMVEAGVVEHPGQPVFRACLAMAYVEAGDPAT